MLESHTFPLYASDINDFIMMECKENYYLMRLYDSAKSQNGIEANSNSMFKFLHLYKTLARIFLHNVNISVAYSVSTFSFYFYNVRFFSPISLIFVTAY